MSSSMEKEKKSLRLCLYMPQAHWRVPYTYQRRHTLPLPPPSTIIGFLCNLLGIRNINGQPAPCQCKRCAHIYAYHHFSNEKEGSNPTNNFLQPELFGDINAILYHTLVDQLELSICGTFESKTTEYTWFRNLSKESHTGRFGIPTNRTVNSIIEHPGGQQPVSIDILNNVHLIIHIATTNECICLLKRIEYALTHGIPPTERSKALKCECPPEHKKDKCPLCFHSDDLKNQLGHQERLYPLHLGRAEDWIVIEDMCIIPLEKIEPKDLEPINTRLYHWIPKEQGDNLGIGGLLYRTPTFYSLNNGQRVFHYKLCFLNDGNIVIPPEVLYGEKPQNGSLSLYLDKTPFPKFWQNYLRRDAFFPVWFLKAF